MQEQAHRVGAAWSASGLRLIDGKYPLSVERYVLRQVARLVPGVTTVTPHARYYALHALVAAEAEEQRLDNAGTQELLRRCEVVLAAASHLHGEEHGLHGLPQAHGESRLRGLFTAPTVEFAEAVRPAEDPPPVRLPRLLGATREQGGVRVWLARAAEWDVELRISQYSRPPEEWTALGAVPAGATELCFPVEAEPGSRVGILGSPDLVPVTDVAQTVQRPAAEQRDPAPHQPGDLFRHHALLEELLRSLLDARPEPSPGASPIGSGAPAAPASSGSGTGEPKLPLPLELFALGRQPADGPPDALPGPYATEPIDPNASTASDAPEADPAGRSWFEVFTPEEEAGLEDDTAETEEQPPTDGPPEDAEVAEDALHADRRAVAARLRRARADLPLAPRLLLVRVLLDFLAKDAWPGGDRSWYELLVDVTAPLDQLDPYRLPPEDAESAASLAALVLSVLESQAVGAAEIRRYERLASALAELLLAATEERIAGYVAPELAGRFDVMVEPDHVMELANQLLQGPVTKAVRELGNDRRNTAARQHSPNLLSVHGSWPHPYRAALDALGCTGLDGPVGAWACHDNGQWSFVAWHKPDLIELTPRGQHTDWRHFRLPPTTSPRSLARNPDSRRPSGSGRMPQLNETGRRLLRALDLPDDAAPPPDARAPKSHIG